MQISNAYKQCDSKLITIRLRFKNKEEEMRTFSATDYNPNIGFFRAYHYNPNGVPQRSRDISWG